MEMEGEGIYCSGRSFVSESDNVIETLSWMLCLAPQGCRSWALGIVCLHLILYPV